MRRTIASIVVIAGSCALHAGSVGAQGREGASQNPLGPFTTAVERRRAEQELRTLPLRIQDRRKRNLADPQIVEQMNEDFVRLQTVRGEMVKTFESGGHLDPENLEELAEEVKRRASRLRSMLLLSEREQSTAKFRQSATIESINDMTFKLCIEISRFTENPIFRPNGTFSVRHAKEADQTLGLIVRMARTIQKDAAALRKD